MDNTWIWSRRLGLPIYLKKNQILLIIVILIISKKKLKKSFVKKNIDRSKFNKKMINEKIYKMQKKKFIMLNNKFDMNKINDDSILTV